MEGGEVYHIGGHKVMFPFKPYPTQFDMMSKILRGLDKKQNCLLESPTGSGKTLALLCASLAWQQTEHAKLEFEINDQKKYVPCEACQESSSEMHLNKNNSNDPYKNEHNKSNNPCCAQEVTDNDALAKTPAAVPPHQTTSPGDDDDDDDKDFVDFDKRYQLRQNKPKSTKRGRPHLSIAYEMPDQHHHQHPHPHSHSHPSSSATTNNTLYLSPRKESMSTTDKKKCTCHCNENEGGPTPKKRVPTIFFGSRTHKQLKQVIKELKQSDYKNVRMTLLASRDHMCINPRIKKMVSITEGCKDLLETDFCRFNHNVKRFNSQAHLRHAGVTEAWDVEDLLNVCSKKSICACPYFVSRSLITQSDIVFCPYNYFIDPIIREIVGIQLSNNVVIVDEAHNIEGSCREATSFSITKTSFKNLREEIEKLLTLEQNLIEYNILLNLAKQFISLINSYSNRLDQKDFNQSCKIWSGFDIVAQLANVGIGSQDYTVILGHFKKLCSDIELRKEKNNLKIPSLKSPSLSLLEQLLIILGFFYAQNLKNVEDFRMAIVKSTNTSQVSVTAKKRYFKQSQFPIQEFTLHLWCMNPGVGFGDFHAAHCVILASGTLSPMLSFQSELQMPFQVSMEGRHIIPPSQVWVGSVGSGPSGKQLKATYKITETYTFQDELGNLVLDVCLNVPNGVLCFLSSYTFLEKLSKRWQTTGVWEKMLKRKAVVTEPRSGKKDFERIWNQFLQFADGQFPLKDESTSDDNSEEKNEKEEPKEDLRDGALFLAVCRGKLSEGTDFANNSARAVITVGIPYPYVNDVQIGLKKEYNDLHKSSRNLLSGSEWFEIQAYRALNQALGRCIRHKDDWGAIILVDDRFLRGEKYVKGLSKWVRGMLKPQYNYYAAMKSLEHFARTRSNGDNCPDAGSQQSVLDSTISKNNSEQSIMNMTDLNVNTLKNLCSNTAGVSTSQVEPLITSTLQVEPLITSTLQMEPLITSTPLQKSKCSSISESDKSTELLPVNINGISVIPKTLDCDTTENNHSDGSTVFPMNSDFNNITNNDTPQKKKKSIRERLEFEKDRLSFKTLEKRCTRSELTKEPVDETGVELELSNTQLVDETLKSEVLPTEINLIPRSVSERERAADIELNDKSDIDPLCQIESQSSPGLFSNSDSDILSIDENYLEEINKTVVAKAPPSNKDSSPNSSDGDKDLLSYIENEKRQHSVDTSADTLDDDADLMSFVESEAENLSAFTADKSKPLPDVDMKDEDLLSFVENEESNKAHMKIAGTKNKAEECQKEARTNRKEDTSDPDTRQLLSRRPLFKTSFKPSQSLTNEASTCNVRMAPKRYGCEDVVLNEFFEQEDSKEEKNDLDCLKTKRFVSRRKRPYAGHFNTSRKKVKGVVFEEPSEEKSEVICQICRETLLTVLQIVERKPEVPPFLTNIFTPNFHPKEMYFLDSLKTFCKGFEHLMPVTSSPNGVLLNSAWFPDLACCVQYLHCPKCQSNKPGNPPPHILGAKVMVGTKEYTTGQVWLSGSAVKIVLHK